MLKSNRLKVTGGEGEGDNGREEGKGLEKNMYEWPVDLDISVGPDCGSRGWDGRRKVKGERLGQL